MTRVPVPLLSLSGLLLAGILVAGALPALASAGGAMPWDAPLDTISANLSGPTARRLMIIAIVVVGLGMMFSEGGGLFRKLLYVAAGGILVSAAASWGLPFMGFAEAAPGPRPVIPPMDAWLWCWMVGVLFTFGTLLGLHMETVDRRRGYPALWRVTGGEKACRFLSMPAGPTRDPGTTPQSRS